MNDTPSAPGAGTDTVLDHVAVAVERWSDAWPCFVHRLGGIWHSGGINRGFSPAQLSYANGAKVEVLQPWEPQDNPFLRRFLDRRGPGPHHLTVKVPDIVDALDRVRGAGFDPVGVNLADPHWKEAFLHPRQATGVVVQLAQAADGDWVSPAPEGFPVGPQPSASLLHVTHVVRDLGLAVDLFHGLLGASVAARLDAPDGAWRALDVTWSGPLALRLVTPGPGAGAGLRHWLGDAPGRVHHLAFVLPQGPVAPSPPEPPIPAWAVPGVEPEAGPVVAVAAEENLGTGLVLRGPPAPPLR